MSDRRDIDRTDGLDTDEGVGGVTAGDFDLGGVDEAQDRRVEGGDPVTGDATNRVGAGPPQTIDPDIAQSTSEPIRVSDRGPYTGGPPEDYERGE